MLICRRTLLPAWTAVLAVFLAGFVHTATAGLADFEKQISNGAKAVESGTASGSSTTDGNLSSGDCNSFAECFFGALAEAMLRGFADWLIWGMADMYASSDSGEATVESETKIALDALNGEQTTPVVIEEPQWQGQIAWNNGVVSDTVFHSSLGLAAIKDRLHFQLHGDYFRDSETANQMGLSRFYVQYWSRQDRSLRIAFGLGASQLSSDARLRSSFSFHSALRYHVDPQWQLDLRADYSSFASVAVEDYSTSISWRSPELPALQAGLVYRSLQVGGAVLAGPQVSIQYRF